MMISIIQIVNYSHRKHEIKLFGWKDIQEQKQQNLVVDYMLVGRVQKEKELRVTLGTL